MHCQKIIQFFVVLLLILTCQTWAVEKAEVGVLRYVSSGGLFLAIEKGYFAEQDIDISLKFFESAQPISLAVVSGDVDFGVTALTAGFFNLAGKGALKIIAAQADEKKGLPGNKILVSNKAYQNGLDLVNKLTGKRFGITQVGSSFHYQIGKIAQIHNFDLRQLELKPLQSLPNMMAALKSNQIDAIIIAAHLADDMVAAGDAKEISLVSDSLNYQYGALFTSTKLLSSRQNFVERFLKAYRQGAAEYARTLLKVDANGKRVFDAQAQGAAALIAKYVYPNENVASASKKVMNSAFSIVPDAVIKVNDIAEQIQWLQQQGLVDSKVDVKDIVDSRIKYLTKP